jgi:hypothetical protein
VRSLDLEKKTSLCFGNSSRRKASDCNYHTFNPLKNHTRHKRAKAKDLLIARGTANPNSCHMSNKCTQIKVLNQNPEAMSATKTNALASIAVTALGCFL